MSRAARIRTIIVLAWVLLVAWLVRYEAFPEYFTHSLAGYKSLLAKDVMVEDRWMRLLFKDQPIGYSHSSVELDETDPMRHYTVANRLYARIRAMGLDQPVFADTIAYIDAMHVLRRFEFTLSSGSYKMSITARRGKDQQFHVVMKTGNTSQKSIVTIPDDVILYSPMTEMALRDLEPGEELRLKTFDPATLSPAGLTIRALRREVLKQGGREYNATVLASDYQGLTVQSWMGEDGTLLRQETPFGWIMESCTDEEAFATIKASGYSGDFISELAIRCKGAIDAPRECRGLRLRLSGVQFSAAKLETNRQKVGVVEDGAVELTVRAAQRPASVQPEEGIDLAPYLASSPFVQAADPKMVAAAEDIVGDRDDPWERALAIYTWVDTKVRNEMTISLPSALDVLETRAGDCNEHTYLFTGLARAVGIPTKIMVGVAYHEGSFYYHAWPAVYVGGWIEMDPTWGQQTVDATHIRLAEGELGDQMELMTIVGRAEIEVLEQL